MEERTKQTKELKPITVMKIDIKSTVTKKSFIMIMIATIMLHLVIMALNSDSLAAHRIAFKQSRVEHNVKVQAIKNTMAVKSDSY